MTRFCLKKAERGAGNNVRSSSTVPLQLLKQRKTKSATNDIAIKWKYLIIVVLIKNRVIENAITR